MARCSTDTEQVVYLSDLLPVRYPQACARLTAILDKHHVRYAYIQGTRDVWCRDYMPVQTPSGRLVQFRYEPSYLCQPEWEHLRSDVREVCRLNGLTPLYSDINLDGGNVLLCDGRAIISDRVFDENPSVDKDVLLEQLSQLLESEVLIVPTIHGDMTGHADGMVRFVNRDTLLGNSLADEYDYWRKGMQRLIDRHGLHYINMPFFLPKQDKKHRESAIGVYVNYLEVGPLMVVPVFGREEDDAALEVLRATFPQRIIETIDYCEVALDGGLLNCTTWVATL